MTETMELPRERWADYLAALSNRDECKSVRIEMEGRELGDQIVAEAMPLVGISLEEKGSQKNAIEITLGGGTRNAFTHMIDMPEHVYVEQNGDRVVCLDIEDGQQIKTLIFFEEATGTTA